MIPDKHAGPWYRPRPARPAPERQHTSEAAKQAVWLTGKRATQAKKAAGYEEDVPRCETCRHFRKAGNLLVNSMPRHFPARCTEHTIKAHPMAVCNTWASTTGDTLA